MALILSAATGNFNAGGTWVGGIVPGAADEARASTTHVITITANVTCTELSNAGTGTYVLNNGVTLTANVTHKSATLSVNCLTFSAASPATASIVGNCTAASAGSGGAVLCSGSGTLSVTGNVIGASVINSNCIINSSTGTVNITGNLTAGSATNAGAVFNSSTGSINVIGNVTASTSAGVTNNGAGALTITGNVLAAAATGVSNASAGPLTITGNITASTAAGVTNSSTATLTISGGTYTASTLANAIISTNASSVVRASGSFIHSSNGFVPINTPKFILLSTPTLAKTRYALNGSTTYVDMFTADNSFGQAAITDVRLGTVYASGILTGTLAVPAASSVGFGVPVDATTGTAALTPASVWDHLLSAITTSDTIGTLLKTNIDTTISSRSTATTAGIADAVWDEVLTGATHNIASSAGRRLRALGSQIILENSAVTSTTNSITFNGLASAITGAYDPALIYIVEGTGVGQCRNILEYRGATKTAIVDRDWRVPPDATSNYVIVANAGREHVNEGAATGGSSNTIILNASASTTDDAYNGQVVFIRSGTGADQARRVVGYVGSTRTATVDRAWATTPTTESAYVMLPTGEFSQDYVSTAIRTELTPELDEIGEIHAIHGLKTGDALTVTPTSRIAGAISQTISGDGTTTTTVSRD